MNSSSILLNLSAAVMDGGYALTATKPGGYLWLIKTDTLGSVTEFSPLIIFPLLLGATLLTTARAWLSNGNGPFVQEKLGHKKAQNTMKYIKRTGWKLILDFEVVTASRDEEIKKNGEAEYQKYDERTVDATHVSYYCTVFLRFLS